MHLQIERNFRGIPLNIEIFPNAVAIRHGPCNRHLHHTESAHAQRPNPPPPNKTQPSTSRKGTCGCWSAEPDGLVSFEFSIGWPELAVELMLPAAAFDEFCAKNQVIWRKTDTEFPAPTTTRRQDLMNIDLQAREITPLRNTFAHAERVQQTEEPVEEATASAEVTEETPEEAPTEPAPDTATEDAVAEALAEALAEELATEEVAAAEPAASDLPAGPPMTAGEQDALRVAVQACWNVGALSMEALRTTVTVAVSVGQDGVPDAGSITMVASNGESSTATQQAFEAARRAIIRCGARGFPLPPEKFDQWRNMELVFDPNGMRMR